jgi:hypothetical protein
VNHRVVGLLLGLVALLASAAAEAAAGPARTSAWAAVSCDTFGLVDAPASVDCGYVSVPRRHAEPAGPTINLATVIVRAPAEGRVPDPVFIAQGGPGGSSISAFAQAIIDDPSLRLSASRDHVLWEIRSC